MEVFVSMILTVKKIEKRCIRLAYDFISKKKITGLYFAMKSRARLIKMGKV